MITFRVEGPFKIPVMKGAAGRVIDKEARNLFWEQNANLGAELGCYVFGIRAGKGIVPVYVGQAKRTFAQECLADQKLMHYNTELARRHGTPVLFFVALDGGTSGALETCLDHVEHFLIQLAVERNPHLANVQKVEWSIQGSSRVSFVANRDVRLTLPGFFGAL